MTGCLSKVLYTNTHGIEGTEDKLEVCIPLKGCDLIGNIGTWWDNSLDCRAAVDGYRLFRKDRLGC